LMPMPTSTLRIFIDESGTPSRFDDKANNTGERYFTLAAVLMKEGSYRTYKANIRLLYKKYDAFLKGQELKSRYIRRSNPIHVDPRHSIDDKATLQSYEKFAKSGSWYVNTAQLQHVNLYNKIYFPDSHISTGLQLADLVANPIRNYHLRGANTFFDETIKVK